MGYIEGTCRQSRNFSVHALSFNYEKDPCPKCGGLQTCDIDYSDSFTKAEINQIMKDYSPSSNIFPGDNEGRHNPVLIIFLDHEGATLENILAYIRKRIFQHHGGLKTSRIHFHAQTYNHWMKLFPGSKTRPFKILVDKIRFVDPSFAEDGITFEDNNHRFNPNARKNASRNFRPY
jgi:hypothetical protein